MNLFISNYKKLIEWWIFWKLYLDWCRKNSILCVFSSKKFSIEKIAPILTWENILFFHQRSRRSHNVRRCSPTFTAVSSKFANVSKCFIGEHRRNSRERQRTSAKQRRTSAKQRRTSANIGEKKRMFAKVSCEWPVLYYMNLEGFYDKFVQVVHVSNHWVCVKNYNPWFDKNKTYHYWWVYDSMNNPLYEWIIVYI